jgi:zinc transport system substrate-binding protein
MNLKKVLGIALLVAVVATAIILANMQRTTGPTNTINVTTTFYPLYEFAKAVGGDKATVTNLTPAGAEPHDFEPTPQALADLQRADIFAYNGGMFEPWVDKFLPDYKNTAVNAGSNISLKTEDGVADPHYWLDPTLAVKAVEAIRDGYIKAAPQHEQTFRHNADAYIAKLNDVHTAYEKGLKTCSSRTIVTAHDAFTYVAARYGLELIPIAGVSPEAEPSPAQLAEITQLVRQKGVTTIFFERLVSPQLADTIAKETGAKTAILDPIEGLEDEDQKQGKTYLSLQQDNITALRAALGCQ